MASVIIKIEIQDAIGKAIPLGQLGEKDLRQVRFRLLVEAGKIANRIYELTGKTIEGNEIQ